MAIEDIFKALDEQADAECSELVRAAEGQAAAVLAEANAQADRVREQRLQGARELVGQRTGKTINAAKLDNKKHLAAVRESVVKQVFEDAAVRLGALRATEEYESVFRALAEEALAGVEGECTMHVDPADAGLAEKAAKELNASCTIDPSLQTSGGVVVSTENGRILRSNTFETRLAKSHEFTYARVSEILG
ncbi:MAG: V-type ATP synthase subunit E [Coriobacteriia bacterium]|nr:V-type ATP synthase subunit E [Coriobacteriia bacterium]MBN2823264.1 V-type ATP synthase subunit E [Coriobacteriia bacterium]